jgi:hypothetical protein
MLEYEGGKLISAGEAMMQIYNNLPSSFLDEWPSSPKPKETVEEHAARQAAKAAEHQKFIFDRIEVLKDAMRILDMPVSLKLLEFARGELYPEMNAASFNMLRNAIHAEIDRIKLFYMPSDEARFYETDLVAGNTKDAFPGAASELRLAGNALSVGLHTACVLHAMRAAEIGMRSLARTLKCEFDRPLDMIEWHPLLEQCESRIAAMKKLKGSQQKADDLRFYSEAAANFRYFKDGWRVYAAHARTTFTGPEARNILVHTGLFFDKLSERLNEASSSEGPSP